MKSILEEVIIVLLLDVAEMFCPNIRLLTKAHCVRVNCLPCYINVFSISKNLQQCYLFCSAFIYSALFCLYLYMLSFIDYALLWESM